MDYRGAGMDDFRILVERLVAWVNVAPLAPVVFAEPGFRQDLLTPAQPLVELYLVTEGAMELDVHGERCAVSAGELALANAHYGNRGRETQGPFRYGCISLSTSEAPDAKFWSERPRVCKHKAADVDSLRAVFSELSRLFHGPDQAFRDVLVKAQLLTLLVRAAAPVDGGSTLEPLPAQVRRAIELMGERRSDPKLNLARLARHARVSSSHLVRLFQNSLGVSPMRYLTEMRIRHAQHLLERSPLTIKEVAFLVGFADQLYFSRVFRQETGHAPTAFRQRFLGPSAPAKAPQ
ncbi:MAG: AraC family transcriptional regulator [Deltaproteobacteria bacterium]|nr:AraC family transcriptional regulator [Deltaproteobacteria bacterium]